MLATVGAWGGVLLVAAVVGLASGMSEPLVDSYRRSLRRLTPVATSREDRTAFTLVRFESEHPVAVAVPGRRPEILVSSALEQALTPAQLRAVLAHEYAHLTGRHGLLVRLAELNASCLPRFVPAGTGLRRATVMLVELVADDVAARQAGSAQVAVALERLAQVSGEAGFLVRAERLRALPAAGVVGVGLPEPVRV
ncbi:M56 family metallopeptidase [Tessaracoccus sp. HDW20]|uniref:M56 family metallopeptidase n=1 Tax=Tessaracoccus coleopterorum TaxID=2714950 RepID=UPI0018D3BFCD|nr:M56 family metallopeptidase [Tessaracoccus coleopterorum]NHB84728.1 M56 family metallopeptidase [Tessaracoccus coleopterorum]